MRSIYSKTGKMDHYMKGSVFDKPYSCIYHDYVLLLSFTLSLVMLAFFDKISSR